MFTALPPLAMIAKEAGEKVLAMKVAIVTECNANGGPNAKKDSENITYKPEDGSPCTSADLKAHQIVCEGLKKNFPGIPIVSEEGTKEEQEAALKARDRFETDPLDNTKGYIQDQDGFSVNIGRIVDGVPTEGVIYFPEKRELYYTGSDGKAYLKKGDDAPQPISVKQVPLRSPLKVAVGFSENVVKHLGERLIEKTTLPGQLRTCSVARGDFDITGINHGAGGGFNSYDIAGPHAVLRAAGGEILTYPENKPLRYNGESLKVPAHYAGGVDTLIALQLLNRNDINIGLKRG